MTERVINFCAGPCTLPLEVLQEAQAEFVNYQDSGMSLFEMSHRSAQYDAVHQETLSLLRELYATPDDFEVLLVQGGATLQFAMVPMNLLGEGEKAAYAVGGAWGKKAFADAKKIAEAYAAYDGSADGFSRMPTSSDLALQPGTRYLHVTSNETIGGIRMVDYPEGDIRLVGDMSSDYLSRAIPWDRFDVVYGGAQKNLGPAGVAVAFVRKSVIEAASSKIPAYLHYGTHAGKDSLYNTPPVFAIYMMGKVLKWVKANGGLSAMESNAAKRAGTLYGAIDSSDGYYKCPVFEAHRSHMNVVWRLPSEDLEKKFIQEAQSKGMANLKGHRSVGGCRASLYNAMTQAGVETLAQFMADFKKANS